MKINKRIIYITFTVVVVVLCKMQIDYSGYFFYYLG